MRREGCLTIRSPKVVEHLLSKGIVYVLRKERRRTGLVYARFHDGQSTTVIGLVFLSPVSIVTRPEQLATFVNDSGFDSVDEWLTNAYQTSRCRLPAWLYKIEMS
jgi:hypothetical protein